MDRVCFGARLKQVRKDCGLTGEQLAELCHIAPNHLRQIESGKRGPSLDVLVSLCNALRVSPDYLLRDALTENERSAIPGLEQLWATASPSQFELAAAVLRTILEQSSKGQT